jgi:hypothetical protein
VSRRGRRRARKRPASPPGMDVDDGLHRWIEYCGGRMWVVGFTEGGAPYGSVEWSTAWSGDDGTSIPAERDDDKPFATGPPPA